MEKTPILDSRKSNSVLGPEGLPPAPSSSSSFLDLPLPLPLAVENTKQVVTFRQQASLINQGGGLNMQQNVDHGGIVSQFTESLCSSS